MKFNELDVKPHRKIKRLGRGIAAGQGKTAGRGTKGQKARAGSSKKPGFAGGQNPLMQQLPKLPGFRSFKIKPENVFTDQLNSISQLEIGSTELAAAGLISNPYVNVKILFRGEIEKKLTVKLPSASAKAIDAIQLAGGSFNKVDRLARTQTGRKGNTSSKKVRSTQKSAKPVA